MSLTLLPYEILQLIAGSLLPRYQCRLALASKHCYRYLYTDLLHWHARKDALSVPKYECWTRGICAASRLQCSGNKKLVIYELYCGHLRSDNLTTLQKIYPGQWGIEDVFIGAIHCIDGDFKIDILSGYCAYVHINVLIYYVQSRHPLLHMLTSKKLIFHRIAEELDESDMRNFVRSNKYTPVTSVYGSIYGPEDDD